MFSQFDVYNINGNDSASSPNCATKCITMANVCFTILSSVGSVVGSLLIIGTFLKWQDLRTVARMILVFLAVSDLLTGLGYIFGAAVYIDYYYVKTGYCPRNDSLLLHVNQSDPRDDPTYKKLCMAQSFLTTLMPMASFLWTANLAIYLFFSIVWQRIKHAKILMAVFHITAWGIPLVTCIAVASEKYFGASGSRSSGGWCWIKYNETEKTQFYVVEFMAGKVWEIGVCALAIFVCVATKIIILRRVRKTKKVTVDTEYSSISIDRQMQAAYYKVDQKLVWIPIVFLFLRMWGNIRFIISLFPNSCNKALYNPFLVYMQSIGDPGQGWSNALLFVVFNQKILYRLFPWLPSCWEGCVGALASRCCKCSCDCVGGGGGRRRRHRVVLKQQYQVNVPSSKKEEEVKGEREKEPLLTDSLRSSNLSSSVLYHTGGGGSLDKPRAPSINSKY